MKHRMQWITAVAAASALASAVVWAQQAPTKPVISWMDTNQQLNGKATIEWNMWWGTTGTKWNLLSNGVNVGSYTEFGKVDNPANVQKGSTTVTWGTPGAKSLVIELCNANGCTKSDPYVVTVAGGSSSGGTTPAPTPAPAPSPNPSPAPSPAPAPAPTPAPASAPGQATLDWMSSTVAANEVRTVKWNMWWGQRAEKWRLKQDGVAVTDFSTQFLETGPLNQQGKQSGQVSYTFKKGGLLQVELCNGATCTTGAGVTLSLMGSVAPSNNTNNNTNNNSVNPAPAPAPTPTPPAPPAPAPTADFPCTGVKHGKPETVSAACMNKLNAMNYGGAKHVPNNPAHLPLLANGKPAKEAYGYFVEWSSYGRKFNVGDFNAAQYSKVLFSFLRVMPDGSLKIMDDWATLQGSHGMDGLYNYQQPESERGMMLALTLLKARHPHLKTAFSVGGWTLSGQFSKVAANPATRAAFIKNMIDFANKYGFDGIDIDWEYPVAGGNLDTYMPGVNYIEVNKGAPEDKQNFNLLLKELRAAVNAEAAVNSRTKTGKKEISIAVGLGPKVIDSIDYAAFLPYVDTVNLMAYDFNGGWSTTASHNAPFYNNRGPAGGLDEFSTYDGILNILWNASGKLGMRKEAGYTAAARAAILTSPIAQQVLPKLVVGVPYYGRSWTTTQSMPTSTDYTPWFTGTEANSGSFEKGVWDTSDIIYLRDNKKQNSALKGRTVDASLASARWMGEAWDAYACANLAWVNVGGANQLVSYNDEDSLQHIARFVVDKNLGGTMVWETDGDTHGDGTFRLSKAVMFGLNKQNTNIDGKPLKVCNAGGREAPANATPANNTTPSNTTPSNTTPSNTTPSNTVTPTNPVAPTPPATPAVPGAEPTTLANAVKADQTKRTYVGYYPSWSDNWFSSKGLSDDQILAASKFARIPGVYTHVVASFAQPNFSFDGTTWRGTGLNFNAAPADIAAAIQVLKKRNMKVLLAVGGATYHEWDALAAEGANGAAGPVTNALVKVMKEVGFDGLDVDYEVEGADAKNVARYKNAVKAMRKAVDLAGGGRLLTLAGWSTGADCTPQTSLTACGGKTSYWGGSAGRERQIFADQTMANMLDMVSIMSYDARYENYDAVTTYKLYRQLFPAKTIVNIGLETPPEGWAGGLLVVNNADAQCEGSKYLKDQLGNVVNQPYSVERLIAAPMASNVNSKDGAMLWEVLKTADMKCGNAKVASPGTIAAKISSVYGLPADLRINWK